MTNEGRTDPRLVVLAFVTLIAYAIAGSTGVAVPLVPGGSMLSNGSLQLAGVTLTTQPPGGQVIWVPSTTTADSTTLSNPTANTTFSQTVTIKAGALAAGRAVRFTAFGKYTTGASATPTLELAWNISGTQFATPGAISTAINLTDKAWRSSCLALCRTTGSSGTMFGEAEALLGGLLAATVPDSEVGRSGSFAIDSTVDNKIGPTAKFGASDASNAITCEGIVAEFLN